MKHSSSQQRQNSAARLHDTISIPRTSSEMLTGAGVPTKKSKTPNRTRVSHSSGGLNNSSAAVVNNERMQALADKLKKSVFELTREGDVSPARKDIL